MLSHSVGVGTEMSELKIKWEFEDIPDNFTFGYCDDHDRETSLGDNYTWKQLKEKYKSEILNNETAINFLKKHKIKRIEIGSFTYFYYKNVKLHRNRTIALSTMHIARFLKR